MWFFVMHVCICMRICTYVYDNFLKVRSDVAWMHVHTYIHTYIHTHAHYSWSDVSHIHTHTYTHKHANTYQMILRICTLAGGHIHIHTHVHTHTYRHTHTKEFSKATPPGVGAGLLSGRRLSALIFIAHVSLKPEPDVCMYVCMYVWDLYSP